MNTRAKAFCVLILIVVMVATVTGLFMVNLYQIYTRMVFMNRQKSILFQYCQHQTRGD